MKPLWLRLLPYVASVGLIAALLAAVFSFGVHVEHQGRVAEVAELRRVHQGVLDRLDIENRTALAAAQQAARKAEVQHATDMAALDEKYTKEMQDAKHKADADIAAVRAGTVRLRHKYTCATGAGSAAGGVPTAGPGASVDHGDTGRGLGPEDAAAILGAADTGDRWAEQLKACQAILRNDRAR